MTTGAIGKLPGRDSRPLDRCCYGLHWNAGLRTAGIEVTHEIGKWTRQTVLDALRRLERELGRPPTAGALYRSPGPSYPTTTIVSRKLGSWAEACRELGWPAASTDNGYKADRLRAIITTQGTDAPAAGRPPLQ